MYWATVALCLICCILTSTAFDWQNMADPDTRDEFLDKLLEGINEDNGNDNGEGNGEGYGNFNGYNNSGGVNGQNNTGWYNGNNNNGGVNGNNNGGSGNGNGNSGGFNGNGNGNGNWPAKITTGKEVPITPSVKPSNDNKPSDVYILPGNDGQISSSAAALVFTSSLFLLSAFLTLF